MDNIKQFYSIKEFAELFNIHKKTLYYYDEIDLFKPSHVNEKGYRFYAFNQIYDFHVLLAIKALNLPVKDVKELFLNVTPDQMINKLHNKEREIDKQILTLIKQKDSIQKRIFMVSKNIHLPTYIMEIVDKPSTPLYVIENIPINHSPANYMLWHTLFSKDNKHQLNEIFYGNIVSKSSLEKKENTPSYLFLGGDILLEDMTLHIQEKGKYLVCRKKGKNLDTAHLYELMHQYIEQHNLVIKGNAYEYFLIDGFFASNNDDRMLEIQIQIE